MTKVETITDCGGGFYIDREKHGSATWYIALHLDAPGGYVQKRRLQRFSYLSEAKSQIKHWRAEDEASNGAQS